MMKDLASVIISVVFLCQSLWSCHSGSAQWVCSAEPMGLHQSGHAKFNWLQQWSCWACCKWRRFAYGSTAKIRF